MDWHHCKSEVKADVVCSIAEGRVPPEFFFFWRRGEVTLTLGVCPRTFPARAREPWTLPGKVKERNKDHAIKVVLLRQTILVPSSVCQVLKSRRKQTFKYVNSYMSCTHTSQKSASYLQGAVLGDTARHQRGIILQRAPSKQQHLILNQETFQSLDMSLGHKQVFS